LSATAFKAQTSKIEDEDDDEDENEKSSRNSSILEGSSTKTEGFFTEGNEGNEG
jgi:hypothetical protein